MGNCKCSNNINPLSLISGAHFCRMWIFVEKISPKNIEIPGIPVVFRLRFTVFKTGWKNLQFESLKKSRSRKSVVHTTSRWSRDESIAWNYPPPTQHPGCKTSSAPGLWTIFCRESQPKPSFVTIASWVRGWNQIYIMTLLLSYPFYLGKHHWFVPLLGWFVRTPLFFWHDDVGS